MSPMIDMRPALTNPYTLDKFNVIRRVQLVSNDGEAQVVPTSFQGVRGIVTPSVQQKDLERMSDAQLMSKALTIITIFALRGVSEDASKTNFQPDIVIWNGDAFLVTFIDDYSNYARGFIRAVAFMMDITAVPPATGKTPLALPTGAGAQHPPLEAPDGARSSFTFPGLPAGSGEYELIWNGLTQGGFTQNGEVITLGSTPQGTTPVPGPGDSFFAIW